MKPKLSALWLAAVLCGAQVPATPGAGSPTSQAPVVGPSESITTLTSRIEDLEDLVVKLVSQISGLEASILDLRSKSSQLEIRESGLENMLGLMLPSVGNVIDLDPYSTRGYTPVWASNGLLLFVGVRSAGPYLAGSKLELEIGNPSTATVKGFKLSISEKGAALPRSPLGFTTALAPGKWTPVTVVLPNVAPEEMQAMTLTVTTDVISLP